MIRTTVQPWSWKRTRNSWKRNRCTYMNFEIQTKIFSRFWPQNLSLFAPEFVSLLTIIIRLIDRFFHRLFGWSLHSLINNARLYGASSSSSSPISHFIVSSYQAMLFKVEMEQSGLLCLFSSRLLLPSTSMWLPLLQFVQTQTHAHGNIGPLHQRNKREREQQGGNLIPDVFFVRRVKKFVSVRLLPIIINPSIHHSLVSFRFRRINILTVHIM